MLLQELLYENNKDPFSRRTKQKYPLLKNKCEAKCKIQQLKHYYGLLPIFASIESKGIVEMHGLDFQNKLSRPFLPVLIWCTRIRSLRV